MRFAMSALSANRMAALLLSALVSSTFAARAEDVEYSKIGWWSISYTKLDDLSGSLKARKVVAPIADNERRRLAIEIVVDRFPGDSR
jgi:hypothetical protein